MIAVTLESIGPYDLQLSLRVARSFAPVDLERPVPETLRFAARIDGLPVLIEVRQEGRDADRLEATLEISPPGQAGGDAAPDPTSLATMAARLINADLDLRSFYRAAADHPVLGPLTNRLHGLKAFRPSSLFEMLVIAVVEQQISLAAAYRIREKLVRWFGDPVGDQIAFPTPATLAEASERSLMECGLSKRKAEYIGGLAELLVTGAVAPEAWALLPDDDVREHIMAMRGFGRWSADYVLVRGLGRPDVVPVDDLAIQSLLGRVLGDGSRLAPDEVRGVLEPFAPFRGLAVFYILAGSRMALL